MIPNMSRVLAQFGQPIRFKCTKTVINDGETERKTTGSVSIQAVIQPIPEYKLQVKPEGQRSWKWWTLWTTAKLSLNDVLEDSHCKKYKVMSEEDWGSAGYYSYQLTEAPL